MRPPPAALFLVHFECGAFRVVRTRNAAIELAEGEPLAHTCCGKVYGRPHDAKVYELRMGKEVHSRTWEERKRGKFRVIKGGRR